MFYHEEKQNLFSLPSSYMLGHCISADYALGAGIAKEFARLFNMKYHLCNLGDRYQWDGHGRCAIIDLSAEFNATLPYLATRHVANLITKERYYFKPTIQTVREALESMRNQVLTAYPDVHSIGMPQIACGLDKLEWRDVRNLLWDVFEQTPLEICVCQINLKRGGR